MGKWSKEDLRACRMGKSYAARRHMGQGKHPWKDHGVVPPRALAWGRARLGLDRDGRASASTQRHFEDVPIDQGIKTVMEPGGSKGRKQLATKEEQEIPLPIATLFAHIVTIGRINVGQLIHDNIIEAMESTTIILPYPFLIINLFQRVRVSFVGLFRTIPPAFPITDHYITNLKTPSGHDDFVDEREDAAELQRLVEWETRAKVNETSIAQRQAASKAELQERRERVREIERQAEQHDGVGFSTTTDD
ncbi:hypothetical protein Scep_016561 [Stephania cephalantha]|uniref:Uncharacterized protein n=1 Tax=Stephania cephalantha TaxID=152367 RepID=A0AAP0IMW9_9MAGN